jgi:asparagine N-glycosylation enzyme membrane subunit Stt3
MMSLEAVTFISIFSFVLNFRWAIVARKRNKNPIVPAICTGFSLALFIFTINQMITH